METKTKPIYQRVVLKLSGEILQGTEGFGIDISVLNRIIVEVRELVKIGVQLGIVIGGGNLFRGSGLVKNGINRVISDYIGMLSTIINGLAVYGALRHMSVCSSIMSAIPLIEFCNNYNWVTAMNLLSKNQVVIFVAGTGNPLFTTDSAACLRGVEINADAVLKATKVDGVFSTDPVCNSNAVLYDQLSYRDVLEKNINVMDLTAFVLARDYNLPIHVFNINKKGALKRVMMGYKEGTLISNK